MKISYTSINDNHTILLQVVCRAFFFNFSSSFLYLTTYTYHLPSNVTGLKSLYVHIGPSPPLCNVDKTLSSNSSFCILPFSNIERGNGGADTYSVGITVMISCFWSFYNTICSCLVATFQRTTCLRQLNMYTGTVMNVNLNCCLHDHQITCLRSVKPFPC